MQSLNRIGGERVKLWNNQIIITTTTIIRIISLLKVIWEEGRIAALSHTYSVKSPLVTMTRPKFAPKTTLFRGSVSKPTLPHPWTRPTYDAKRHPDPIRRFSTMHWTDRGTDAPTDRPTHRSSTGKFDHYRPMRYRATRPNNNNIFSLLFSLLRIASTFYLGYCDAW